MTENEAKTKVFTALAEDPKVSLRELSDTLGYSYPTLLKWRNEYHEALKTNQVTTLLDLDSAVLSKAFDTAVADLAVVAPGELSGITAKAAEVKAGVANLNILQAALQNSAIQVVHQINLALATDISCRDIAQLASALTSIQTAFFTKPSVNVLVDNSVNSNSMLAAFKQEMKP